MPKIRENAIEHLATGIEYDGPPFAQRLQLEAGGLADAPPNSVTPDRVAEGARSGKTHSSAARARCIAAGTRFGEAESGKQGARVARTVVVHFSEIAGSE